MVGAEHPVAAAAPSPDETRETGQGTTDDPRIRQETDMPRVTVGTETSALIDIHSEDHGFGRSVGLIHGLRFYNVDVLGGPGSASRPGRDSGRRAAQRRLDPPKQVNQALFAFPNTKETAPRPSFEPRRSR
jgi:hypothetical protein